MLNYVSNPVPPRYIAHLGDNIYQTAYLNQPIMRDPCPRISQPLNDARQSLVEPTFSPCYTYSYPTIYLSPPQSHSQRRRSLFNHAFDRIHGYAGGSFGPGVGMHEARHWHRKAYGGLVSFWFIS
jgi:hypothetical protein